MRMQVTREDTTKTLRTSDNASDPAVSWKVKCLNCGAALAGPYCAECGQRAMPPHPTTRELIGDAVSEFLGWDGRFSNTLRLLVTKPGELTRQWVEGRRVHFISPVRLYLATSLVFFLVTASAPQIRRSTPGQVEIGGVHIGTGPSSAQRVGAKAQAAVEGNQILTRPERDSAIADIAKAPAILQPMFLRAIDEPTAFTDAIRGALPKVLFALVPLFAGILGLFYRGRNYPEHLFFATHLHTFFFIARTIGNLALFTRLVPFVIVVQVVVAVWLVAYVLMAFRRVYGESIGKTIAKVAGAFLIYALIATPIIVCMAVLVAS